MGRVYFYIIAALILTMLINLVPFQTAADADALVQTGLAGFESGSVGDWSVGDFFSKLFGETAGILVVVGALGGIALSFFSKSPQENFIILPFIVATLTLFMGALWKVLLIAQGYPVWISIPIILIMGPFSVGYIITMVEFFRGNV